MYQLNILKKYLLIILLSLVVLETEAQSSDSTKPGIVSGDVHEIRTKTGIVIAGSSITWGGGNLTDQFSGKVVDYIMNELSTVCLCNQMKYSRGSEEFLNTKQYKGLGMRINHLNSKVEFDLSGDEIAICQTILRTASFGVMQVKADGKVIGTFANHNPTTGQGMQSFTGDGKQVKFLLNHPATYAHEVNIDNKRIEGNIYTGGWSRKAPPNTGYLIIRKFNEQKQPVHYIWFKKAPAQGAIITVKYKYGRIIAFEGSTVGQTTSDEINESPYGEGGVTLNTTSPAVHSSGLEFRYIDKSAFWIHKFTEKKKRHFEIEIIDGDYPYFIINYASNRFHDFMNAGIGGWKLEWLMNEDGINDFEGFFRYFQPDVIINEFATNDDWDYGERKLKRVLTGLSEKDVKDLWTLELDQVAYQKSTNDFTVRVCTGLISGISEFSLTCPQIVGSTVAKGGIIRIGNYHGDNHQVVCKEISTVDLKKGKVTWLEPFIPGQILNAATYNDLVGKECSVRNLSGYQNQYEQLIQNIQKISPQTQILITQPGLSNYRMRQLWGYEIIHRKLAAEYHNVGTIEVTDWLYDFQQGNISGASCYNVKADGSNTYNLPWKGHWQGFEVWVGNENVYGKNCYVDGGLGYSVDQNATGAALNIVKGYEKSYISNKNMKLVFTENVPDDGIIRVVKADSTWSVDYCHTNKTGAFVYGQIYISRLKDILY